VILTAGYILWTLQRVFLGPSEQYRGLPDLTAREWAISIPLVVMTVALGVAPQALLLRWMGPSVDQMVRSVTTAAAANPAPTEPVRQVLAEPIVVPR
jgi:NADH-quinone oxidoreductase subunit M